MNSTTTNRSTAQQIHQLRKNGQLSEAYQMGKTEYTERPEEEGLKDALGWSVWALMRKSIADDQLEQALLHWEECIALTENEMLSTQLAWNAYKLLQTLKAMGAHRPAGLLGKVFSLLEKTPYQKREQVHGYLLNAFLGLESVSEQEVLSALPVFSWDAFKKEDAAKYHNNGKVFPGALERWVYLVCKSLGKLHAQHPEEVRPLVEALIRRMVSLEDWACSWDFYHYKLAQLHLLLGQGVEARKSALAFLPKKSSEYWAWQLLANTFERDSEQREQVLLYAYTNFRGEAAFTLGLLKDLGGIYYRKKQYATAKFFFEKNLDIREKAGYPTDRWREKLQEIPDYDVLAAIAPTEDHLKTCAEFSEKVSKQSMEQRKFKGQFRKHAKGFGFVDDIFVPTKKANRLLNEQTVKGMARKSWDSRKSCWGWLATKVY
ncbi:DUF7017 domain-containing protein [Persicobacter psychrovividus]|uniref:TOTE conflict systems S1/CSD-like domain-containing protein n=1 Tax=Persicobacter psychrovividus TaxID=387638 RepID=A0ABN6LFX3_9BACT|nr:hypothetical protein PEPS_43500 [Persicobacter psychrovividus]